MRIYEGMFVLDDARCSENWDAVTREVHGLLEKNQAEIFTSERWDDRRLAYSIRGHSRGIYLLVRFTAPSSVIASLERDCQLNDTILRVLFTRDESSEKLHKAGLLALRPGDPVAPPEPAPAPQDAAEEPAAEGDASPDTKEDAPDAE